MFPISSFMCSAVGSSVGCTAKFNKRHRRPSLVQKWTFKFAGSGSAGGLQGTPVNDHAVQLACWRATPVRWRGQLGTQEKCSLTRILTSLWEEVWEQEEWRQMCWVHILTAGWRDKNTEFVSQQFELGSVLLLRVLEAFWRIPKPAAADLLNAHKKHSSKKLDLICRSEAVLGSAALWCLC